MVTAPTGERTTRSGRDLPRTFASTLARSGPFLYCRCLDFRASSRQSTGVNAVRDLRQYKNYLNAAAMASPRQLLHTSGTCTNTAAMQLRWRPAMHSNGHHLSPPTWTSTGLRRTGFTRAGFPWHRRQGPQGWSRTALGTGSGSCAAVMPQGPSGRCRGLSSARS